MRAYCKMVILALAAISLSLCLTPRVYATENTAMISVATFDELLVLLENGELLSGGGCIQATADLTVPVNEDGYRLGPAWNTIVTVDMGAYTLYVEGSLSIDEGVEFTGTGENSLLWVRQGGRAYVSHAGFTATAEGGYALWQEEGAILNYWASANPAGLLHYADEPVAVSDSYYNSTIFTPVALVHDNQILSDVLPATDSARVYWQGREDNKAIPVVWDLQQYEEQLAAGERVVITGSYPDAWTDQQPICLIAFQNGNPATFLNCYGMEGRGGWPSATVLIELARPELGCRFEWSQDGEVWLPAEAEAAPVESEYLSFRINFPQEEPPAYPYYISAVVDYPDGSVGYSDVIAIREALAQCGHVGNRGGGTSITGPSDGEEPQPTPTSAESVSNSSPPEAESNPSPTPTAQPTTLPELPFPVISMEKVPEASPTASPHQTANNRTDEPEGVSPGPESVTESPNQPDNTPPAVTSPASPASEKSAEPSVLSEPSTPSPQLGVLPVAAGCTAITVTIGAAGFYLHPEAWKRILKILMNLFRR